MPPGDVTIRKPISPDTKLSHGCEVIGKKLKGVSSYLSRDAPSAQNESSAKIGDRRNDPSVYSETLAEVLLVPP